MQFLALALRLLLSGRIALDSAEELLAGAGQRNVLDSDVDALLDVAVSDLLVDDDTNCVLGYVVDDAGFAVVDLEGHAIVRGKLVCELCSSLVDVGGWNGRGSAWDGIRLDELVV